MMIQRTNSFASEVIGGKSETELANDTADVGGGLHEALKTSRERRPTVQTILEHRRHWLISRVSVLAESGANYQRTLIMNRS